MDCPLKKTFFAASLMLYIQEYSCGELAFNPENGVCDWPYNVPACDDQDTTLSGMYRFDAIRLEQFLRKCRLVQL